MVPWKRGTIYFNIMWGDLYDDLDDHFSMKIITENRFGVSQAVIKLAQTYGATMPTRVLCDSTHRSSYLSNPQYYSVKNPEKTVMYSHVHLFLYYHEASDRIMEQYRQARLWRKPAWLVDLALQPAEETRVILEKNQFYTRYYMSYDVHIGGSTEYESPGIEEKAKTYLYDLLIVGGTL